jgi:hypothetical protein
MLPVGAGQGLVRWTAQCLPMPLTSRAAVSLQYTNSDQLCHEMEPRTAFQCSSTKSKGIGQSLRFRRDKCMHNRFLSLSSRKSLPLLELFSLFFFYFFLSLTHSLTSSPSQTRRHGSSHLQSFLLVDRRTLYCGNPVRKSSKALECRLPAAADQWHYRGARLPTDLHFVLSL